MRTLQEWFDEYGQSHQNATNKLVHWLCVPAIFFSVIGLLASIPVSLPEGLLPPSVQPFAHVGTLVLIIGLMFYLRLSFSMFVGMLSFSILVLLGINYLLILDIFPLWALSLIIFTVAWIGQFIGHQIEGAKPSFLKDVQFLLIGPAWLMGFIYRKLGLRY